jgi:hypothetical protein
MRRRAAWVYWLILKTKVNGLSVVLPQNHWDGLSVLWPQNHWDGFSQFGLKPGGGGFSQFGLKTGNFGFPGWSPKITMIVSCFGPQNQVGYVSTSCHQIF